MEALRHSPIRSTSSRRAAAQRKVSTEVDGRSSGRISAKTASRYLTVDSVRTHYLEQGEGPAVVLLHAGDFGGRAESSWAYNIDALAQRFRVIAPDWLGFGKTDKVYDFVAGRRRMLDHMGRFLELMGLTSAHFVGNSMGASLLVMSVANREGRFEPKSMVLASGGGFVPDNEHRRALLDYDCTIAGMQKLLKAIFCDPKWWEDADYVKLRHAWTLEPGVWECCAAARFKAPHVPERSEFGQADTIPYENIECPTLIVAGAEDKLRLRGYADQLAERIANSQLRVFEKTGHCPNIERADEFNSLVLKFLDRVENAETGRTGRGK